jgi:hypothetical protein
MTRPSQPKATLTTLYAGAVLTAVAAAAPVVDRLTGQVLAAHIRHGYPTYSDHRVDVAVTTWLVLLAAVGVVGLASWALTIWAVSTGRAWGRLVATIAFAAGTTVALSALLTKDTSGEVGLEPLLGWIGLLPCVAGLIAVVRLWRRA